MRSFQKIKEGLRLFMLRLQATGSQMTDLGAAVLSKMRLLFR